MQKIVMWLVSGEERAVYVESLDFVPIRATSVCDISANSFKTLGYRGVHIHGKNRGVLMNTQGAQRVLGRLNIVDRLIHSQIPQPDFSVAATRQKLSHPTSLHMDVRNPLLMFSPHLDHGCSRLQALVEYADGTVTETSNEYVACHLIGSQRRYTGTGASGNILSNTVN